MQNLPEIDPQEYESALLGREQELYSLTGGRSSFSENSPGVALLELLTYIQLEQQQNMNRISSEELKNLCALYGFQPRKQRPACVQTAYISDRPMTAGTKLRAEGTVFELQEDCPPGKNEACAFAKSVEGRVELYQFDRAQPFCFEVFDGSDDLVIGFTQPFSQDKEHSLLICLDRQGRTLPDDLREFSTGTVIRWQYYGNEGGKTGWHDVELSSDGTHGFFCTGEVRFSLKGVHEKNGSVYPLRAAVTERGFDRLPRLCGAYPQHCPALQLDTKCRCVGFSTAEFAKNAMYFSDPLGGAGKPFLFVRTAKGWETADSLGISYETDPAEAGARLVTSSRAELTELFGGLPEQEEVLLLAVYEQDYVRDFCWLHSDGTAGQRMALNFAGVFPERTEVLCGSAGVYSRWRLTDSLESCPGDAEVFALDGNALVFGDNVHGKVPPCGDIAIVSLALTAGAEGNIRPGRFPQQEGFAVLRTEEARGGVTGETPEQTFARVLREPKEKTLITQEDFISCAQSVPGLLIKAAQAFPTVDRNGAVKPNSVTVVIHPDTPEPHRDIRRLGWYIGAVRRRMERLCPITLALTVRFPDYFPVDISIRVRSGGYYVSVENTVRSFFEQYFGELRHEIDHGGVLRAVSRLPGVTGVSGFTVRCSGGQAVRRPDGGVSAPEWCRLYLRELEVRCEE